jgi:CRISPR-associated Csx2 family protein
MAHTLITFLGNVPHDKGGSYGTTTYEVEQQQFSCQFLGLGLARTLKIPRIRILGTSGSMWDVLIDQLGATTDASAWVDLSEAVRHDQVTQERLEQFEQELNQSQSEHVFELRLLPYGFDEGKQVDILDALSAGLDRCGQEVTLDITHGMRHLPVLGMLSMIYLQSIGKATVRSIFYGMFDRKSPVNPVVNLSGLLHIQEWIKCLDQFDKDGDYSVFSPLLQRDGLRGDLLEEAAFLERIGNLALAQQKLNTFWQAEARPQTPATIMFFPQLRERLEWRRSGRRSEWERKLGVQYLGRKDYLRSVIFCYESRISAQVEQDGGDANNFALDREEAERALELDARESRLEPGSARNFYPLKYLRNQLAHGIRARTDSASWIQAETAKFVTSLASNEKKLHQWLSDALRGA